MGYFFRIVSFEFQFLMSNQKIYFLVGHFSKDLLKGESFQLGGTVFYSGILAKKLGFKVNILTSYGKDLKEKVKNESLLQKTKIFNLTSQKSTTFKNIYLKNQNKRKQYLLSLARKITLKNLSKNYRTQILHLAPIFNEIDPKITKKFKADFVGATLQGWLRKRNAKFRVMFSLWKDYKKFLPNFDAAICSIEDIKNNFSVAKEFAKYSKLFVLTTGERGCVIFEKSKITEIFPTKVLRNGYFTGAGDVFASAFFIKFYETKNPYLSGEFANKVAGLHIEQSSKRLFDFNPRN